MTLKSAFKANKYHWMIIPLLLIGCSSAYYGALEKIGFQKRDILVDRVEKAQQAQNDAKDQFASALERFKAVVQVPGSDLEKRYEELNSEFERSEQRAADVSRRIAAVEDVAEALFAEWEDELELYKDQNLRRSSRKKLQTAQKRYVQLIKSMSAAEKKMEPVLAAFRDQVLYLKHNLNARAIDAVRSELTMVETEVAALIKAMETAISAADRFIRTMDSP